MSHDGINITINQIFVSFEFVLLTLNDVFISLGNDILAAKDAVLESEETVLISEDGVVNTNEFVLGTLDLVVLAPKLIPGSLNHIHHSVSKFGLLPLLEERIPSQTHISHLLLSIVSGRESVEIDLERREVQCR